MSGINSVVEIQNLARKVDVRINLFEGYSPKNTEGEKGEALFWRNVVSIYGLLADCDRHQIKQSNNMMELMVRYSLISRDDYRKVSEFWNDISLLRKWFCHNNDNELYYQKNDDLRIKGYLSRAFLLSSEKPETLDEVKASDWSLINSDIVRRYEEYLTILSKALVQWEKSEDKAEILEEWIQIQSSALFKDRELIENVIADISSYEIKNHGLSAKVSQYSKLIKSELDEKKFSSDDIKNIIIATNCYKSNKDIIRECIMQKREG